MKLSEVKAAPDEERKDELLPEGNYPVTVIDAEEITARTGTPGVLLKLEVAAGKHQGRRVFERLWITPKAKWRLNLAFEALGFDLAAMDDEVPESVLIGRRAAVLVGHEQYVTDTGEHKTAVRVVEWGKHPDGPGETAAPPAPVESDDLPF